MMTMTMTMAHLSVVLMTASRCQLEELKGGRVQKWRVTEAGDSGAGASVTFKRVRHPWMRMRMMMMMMMMMTRVMTC
jgi:hypothetical protein